MSGKDTRELIRKLEKQGFEVQKSRNSHFKVFKDGRLVCTLSGTPSDNRALRNARAQLRRAGFQD